MFCHFGSTDHILCLRLEKKLFLNFSYLNGVRKLFSSCWKKNFANLNQLIFFDFFFWSSAAMNNVWWCTSAFPYVLWFAWQDWSRKAGIFSLNTGVNGFFLLLFKLNHINCSKYQCIWSVSNLFLREGIHKLLSFVSTFSRALTSVQDLHWSCVIWLTLQ